MRVVRFGLPALTGLALIFIAVQALTERLRDPGAVLVDAVHGALPPVAAALLLLLTALAISRRSRSGYVLGIGVAILMVLGGAWVIVAELPYLAEGGLGAALGAAVLVMVGVWIVVWAIYGLLVRRARGSFATTWQPVDRQLGIVMGSLAAFAGVAYLALGFVLTDAAAAVAAAGADAQALVAGTTVHARVIDATVLPPTGGSATPEVATLTLEVTFQGATAYALEGPPALCLVDTATARDGAYKPDTFCWGTTGPAIVTVGFKDLTMPSSARTIRLELARGDSPCPFGPGSWDAQVQIAPRVGNSAAAEAYTISTTFLIETSAAPPPSGTPDVSACLASTVSP